MRRIVLAGFAALLLSLFPAHGAWAFGVKDIVQMHGDGIADSLIIQKIDHSGKSFDLNARDLRALKQAGVSDEVISAMLRTEDRDEGYDYYDGYYPPRVYVGLGFGYYGYHAPYYGGCWPYRYHAYFGPRYYGHYPPRHYQRYWYGRPGFGYSRPGYGYARPGYGTRLPGHVQPGPVTRHR